jgi:hypothetical protein
VYYENHIHKYENLHKKEYIDFNNVYPILTFPLIKALNLPFENPSKENKYKRYYQQIKMFYDDFLNTDEFKGHIPLHDRGFIKVPESRIGEINPENRLLSFKERNVSNNPKKRLPTSKGSRAFSLPKHTYFLCVSPRR